MRPIHIIGQPGAGKTTLIVDIVQELVARNLKVGTIKHTSHAHELDKPGKDSFRHRKAGASPVSMMTREMTAIYLPDTGQMTPRTLLETYYSALDIVLIEGWISGPYQKIEVWRKAVERAPLFLDIPGVTAVVSDDPLDPVSGRCAATKSICCLKRTDVAQVVAHILGRIHLSRPSEDTTP